MKKVLAVILAGAFACSLFAEMGTGTCGGGMTCGTSTCKMQQTVNQACTQNADQMQKTQQTMQTMTVEQAATAKTDAVMSCGVMQTQVSGAMQKCQQTMTQKTAEAAKVCEQK